MTYGVVLGILFLHLGFMLSIMAYWLAAEALAPAAVAFGRERLRARPVRTLLLGGAIGVPLLAGGFALTKAPIPGAAMIGGGVLLGLLLVALLGSAGLARLVGEGLPARDAAPGWRSVLRGGGVVLLTFAMPLLGWFILLPLALASGVGAMAAYLKSPRAEAAA
ncbi:MAG: hypothetical protein SF028_05585 [Candidatus Sumerlaeia bacterium]|nr:hypothetical protein [Candidatus Sumerlaeia bacterium]